MRILRVTAKRWGILFLVVWIPFIWLGPMITSGVRETKSRFPAAADSVPIVPGCTNKDFLCMYDKTLGGCSQGEPMANPQSAIVWDRNSGHYRPVSIEYGLKVWSTDTAGTDAEELIAVCRNQPF